MVITKILVVEVFVSIGRSFVRPALENIKLVNYEDRVIVTVVLGVPTIQVANSKSQWLKLELGFNFLNCRDFQLSQIRCINSNLTTSSFVFCFDS